ncbi:GAF domain-containing sensor histidine kinase [Baaleninema sp.]|uniref:GAF domain-containing sensor histidine kinase n=1 Tax=Baaleninema sp. TaxID=3101197 RepID=UPI003CFFE480
MLDLDRWEQLRSCCQDEAAFDRLKEILREMGVPVSRQVLSPQALSQNLSEASALARAQRQIQRQQALASTITRIRESLDLHDIFNTTTHELRQLLDADRIAIYRFYEDFSGRFVAESVAPGGVPLLSPSSDDIETAAGASPTIRFDANSLPLPSNGKSPARILEEHGSPVSAIVPILQGQFLWGLLAASHRESDRPWHPEEVELLEQVSVNLGVALKQSELLHRTQQQAQQLAKAAQRQKTLTVTIEKIRRSLDIDTIFTTTTHEVRQLLDVDRVAVYYFNPDWSGQFVAESVSEGWTSLLELQMAMPQVQGNLMVCPKMKALLEAQDRNTSDEKEVPLHPRQVFTIEDVERAGFQPSYLEVLKLYQCRAYAIVPIYQGNALWGMLAAYHNAAARHWETADVELLVQISEHLGVALQQAELLEQTRMQTRRLAKTLQDLQKTQTQLIHSEKMAGLGQLVAGVAHEINNPVNFIYGNLTYVRDYAQDLIDLIGVYREQVKEKIEPVEEKIEEIDLEFIVEDLPNLISSMKTGTDRIRQIVRSLRIFSRLDEAQKKTVDIHEGLDSVLWLLKHRLNSSHDGQIKIVKKYQKIPKITCYAAELNQVFMNLLNNAIDALEDLKNTKKQPTIVLATEQLDEDNILIRIIDNGGGIPEDIKQRIFDPFFTTKAPGKGTGLGLSVSYQIVVENHGGDLTVKSKGGVGTEFAIEIPIKSIDGEE